MTSTPAKRFTLDLELNRFPGLVLLLIVPALLAACDRNAQSAGATTLVPANANLIAQVQVSRILEDADFQSLYQKTPKSPDEPQNFDELLTRAQQETGIDFRRIDTVTLFRDVTRKDEYSGVIAGGPVNESLLLAALSASGDTVVSTADYNGVQVHTAESGGDTRVFAVLDSDTTVLGTLLAVQDVIDVQQGDLAAVSGTVYDGFIGLGSPLVGLAATNSPEILAGLADSMGGGLGFGTMPPAMDSLPDITVMAFLIDKPGQDLKGEARLHLINGDAAARMGTTLDGLIKLASTFSPDENVQYLLERLELNVDGTMVTVSFQAPISEMEKATQAMKQIFGGQY